MADILWSELRMEDGLPPGPDDVVVVNSGDRLIFDSNAGAATVAGLVVYGTFEVEDGDVPLELTTDWAAVVDGGTFKVGSPEEPYEGEFELVLAGKDNDNDVDLSDYPDMGPGNMHAGHGGMSHADHVIENNNAYLMAMGEGSSIEIHVDDAEKESWTQLSQTAQAGDTELHFAESTGWEVGDKIAVASTDFDPDQAEEFTIVGVSDDGKSVILDQPLAYMHYGSIDTYNDTDGEVHELDMRAEVALISRDVTIRGDVDYDEDVPLNQQEDQYGGHTMAMMGGEIYISGVEMAYMGQAGILGRYPVHWHESGDVSGQYIENSSIHHSFNKGVTVHNSQGALVHDNVVYETISHNYYLEQTDTYDNVLTENLGMNARDVGRFGQISGAQDDNPSNFYTPNADNTWIGNHAAGSDDLGFYIRLTDERIAEFGTFEDNTVHSAEGRGLYVHHRGMAQDGNPEGDAEQPQKAADWEISGLTVYKVELGVYSQATNGTITDSVFAEMGANGRFRLNTTIEDSLIVGRSDNVGNPQTAEEVEAGRSLPRAGDFEGWQLYDGPGSLSNVMFDGFTAEDDAIKQSNAIHKSSSFGLENITWGENVDEGAKFKVGGHGNAYGVDDAARGLVDVDGSISGIEGAMIHSLSNDPTASEGFNAGEEYVINEDWGTIITTSGEQSATLTVDNGGTPARNTGGNHPLPFDNLGATRSDGEYANDIRQQVPLFDGYSYELDFGEPEQDNFRLYLGDADWGQSFIVSLDTDVPTDSHFLIHNPNTGESRDAREVSSMEMLEASPDTAVFRDADGQVHVKLVAEMAHGYLWPQPGVAMEGSLNSGVTLLVDMDGNVDLDNLVYDDPQPGDELPPPPYPTVQAEEEDAPMPEEDMAGDHGHDHGHDDHMPPMNDDADDGDMPMPDPMPTENMVAETALVWQEENGVVMIEAERIDLPEGWHTKSSYDKSVAPDVGATGGTNDFVVWQGEDQPDGPGENILTYHVMIENPGTYQFVMRDQPTEDNPEVGGDVWIKVDGTQFYAQDGDSIMYPEGAEPGTYPDGAVMLPEDEGEDGWMNYQSTNTSKHWGSNGHVNDTGSKSDRHSVMVEFDEPGMYTLQVAGGESSSHVISKIGLVNRELAPDFDIHHPETAYEEMTVSTVADPVAEDPMDMPDNHDDGMDSTPPQEAPVNTAPQAVNDAIATDHDTTILVDVLGNDVDADGDPLQLVDVSYEGDTAIVSIVDGKIEVNPLRAFTEARVETITYVVSDGQGDTATGTLSVDVGAAPAPEQEPAPAPAPAPTPEPDPVSEDELLAEWADQIVFHFDGNNNDKDDISAMATAALMTAGAGLVDRTTFLYGNNLSEPNKDDQLANLETTGEFARSLGIDARNYQEDVDATTQHLVGLMSSGEKVLMIEGGPMEAVYRALEETPEEFHGNIVLLSHSTWNENRNKESLPDAEARNWKDIEKDFPSVQMIEIDDQNKGDNNTDGFYNSDWTWMDESDEPVIEAARDAMQGADGKVNDASDSGMLWYALTGDEDGDPKDVEAFLASSGLYDQPYPANEDPQTEPEPAPAPPAAPDADPSEGAFMGENGSIVIEAENTELSGDWKLATVAGETVVLWDAPGSNYNKVDPNETLSYNFVADESGEYHIGLHSARVKDTMNDKDRYENGNSGAERTDTGNDAYVAVIDVATGEIVQEPIKLYTGLGGTDETLRFGSTFDANQKHSPATVELEAGKEYRLEIIGRSDGYALDMITLNKDGVLKDANAPESGRVGEVTPAPAPDPVPEPEPVPAPEPAPAPTPLEVTFSVVDAVTDMVVDDNLTEGEDVAHDARNIVATPNIEVGSAVFHVNGEEFRTENAAPYALFGDNNGDFRAGDLPPGVYDLKVEFFTEADGKGASLGTDAVQFEVEPPVTDAPADDVSDDQDMDADPTQPPVPDQVPGLDLMLSLIDPASEDVIGMVESGDVIQLGDLDTPLGFAATTGTANVGSILFRFSDGQEFIDNAAPFKSENPFGDGQSFAPGAFSMVVEAYAEPDAQGALLGAEAFDFEFVEVEDNPWSVPDTQSDADTPALDEDSNATDGDKEMGPWWNWGADKEPATDTDEVREIARDRKEAVSWFTEKSDDVPDLVPEVDNGRKDGGSWWNGSTAKSRTADSEVETVRDEGRSRSDLSPWWKQETDASPSTSAGSKSSWLMRFDQDVEKQAAGRDGNEQSDRVNFWKSDKDRDLDILAGLDETETEQNSDIGAQFEVL